MTTWSPSLALEPFLRSLKSFAEEARLSKASSIAALSDFTTSFWSLILEKSTSGIAGSAS